MMKTKTILLATILLFTAAIAIAQEGYTVEELIDIGLGRNHSLRLQRENVISARLNLANFYTDYIPNLSLSSNYTHYTSRNYPMIYGDRSFQSSSVSANLTWTLFAGGSRYLSMRSSQSNLNRARITLTDAERETAFNIKSLCYNVIYSDLSYETSLKSLESALNQYELVRAQHELGIASRVDLLKIEVSLANARLDVLRSENNVKSAYRSLNRVLNFALDSTYKIIDSPIDVVFDPEPLEIYKQRAENSTRMQSIKETYRNSLLSANQAYSSFLPRITGTASYSWSDERLTSDFDRYNDDGTTHISVNATWYLIQGGKRLVSLGQAQSTKRSAEVTKELNIQSFQSDIESTYEKILEANSAYALAKAQYESAEIGLELVEEQFRLGNATVLELLDAQVAYKRSHNNLVSALQNFRTNIARMEWLCPPAEATF